MDNNNRKVVITLKESVFNGTDYTEKIFCDTVYENSSTGSMIYMVAFESYVMPMTNVLGTCPNINYIETEEPTTTS